MCKQVFLLVFTSGLAGSAWAELPAYIGSVTNSWATTNAITVTAGSANEFAGNFWWTNTLTGYAFEGAAGPATKPAYEGAPYNSDGIKHGYSVTDTGWLGNSYHPTGLTNPAARPANPYGTNNYAQNWISFEFDKPYEILTFDIWNGSYCGAPGGGIDFSLMDVYVDYKTNGGWLMATNTIKLNHPPDIWDWFPPTDNVAVGLKGVTQVVITPITAWAEDPSWYDPGLQPYWTAKACVSEIRFYIPPLLPLTATREGTDVTISWPTTMPGPIVVTGGVGSWSTVSADGYILEATDALVGGSWSPVSGVANNSVTIANGTGVKFYRLTRYTRRHK